MGHQGVGVALHQHRLVAPAHLATGALDEIQRAALVEERSGRRVEVLGRARIRGRRGPRQHSTADADGRPRRISDGEDDAASELVIRAATGGSGSGEADLRQLRHGHVAAGPEHLAHLIPTVRRPAELELLDRRVGEAAAVQVFERRRAGLALRQNDVVEGDRVLEHFVQPGLAGILTARPLVDLDTGPGRQSLERLREGQTLAAHDEAEDVAALAAAEAVPAVAGRGHDEAGGLLAVERAEPLVGGAGFAQLHLLTDDLQDRQLALDFRSYP